jgi:hypothetical protein
VLGAGIYLGFGLMNFKSNPPQPTTAVEGNNVESEQGSYCWVGLLNLKCVDMISPPELFKHKPTTVSPEAKLTIKFARDPIENTLGVPRWLSNTEIEDVSFNNNILIVPEEFMNEIKKVLI